MLKQSPDDGDGRTKITDEKNNFSGDATSTTAASDSEQTGNIKDEKANIRESQHAHFQHPGKDTTKTR